MTDDSVIDPSAAPRAVVFDFGGVIITPITFKLSELAGRHDTSVALLLEVLLGPRESGDHPWHRAERGEMAVADIQAELEPWARAAGLSLDGDEIDILLSPGYLIIQPMVDRIASLKAAGVRTALLTNTFAEFRPTMESDLDLTLFHSVIESFAYGSRKPEPAIYEATARTLGVAHSDIIYLDDFDQNLAPAQALGWATIHVIDHLTAIDQLDDLLAG